MPLNPVIDFSRPANDYAAGAPAVSSSNVDALIADRAGGPALQLPKKKAAAADPWSQPAVAGGAPAQPGSPVGANPYTGGNDWRSSLSPDEAWIIQRESGFNPNAKNPSSGAFGIWQGLGSTLKTYTSRNGYDLYTTNPLEQLNMFRQYTRDRYGNAANAVAFWQKNGWY